MTTARMPLQDDFDLQSAHVQDLSSPDAIVRLFTLLGYDTNSRLPQTPDAMRFPESLKRETRRLERIASHDDGALPLEVYLAELKSVTVANLQVLARSQRNVAARFLWVLTSDYERIDFVLLEPTLPDALSGSALSLRSAYLRPRVLTVNRRNPDLVALRVLRRYSYTEPDADYQFEKLQSAFNIAEWSEPFFNNRALFSDYYLTERLRESDEWRENPTATLRGFRELFVDVRQRISGRGGAVTRTELLEPALRILGFTLRPGLPATSAGSGDFTLFADGSDQPLACVMTYAWDRTLDGRDDDQRRDDETAERNPGAFVVSLLEHEGAPNWAIVTNGKIWRLYAARAHSRATNYYEIDLEEAIASPDPQLAFRYFWLIFRARAFVPDPRRDERSFLDEIFDGSAQFAKELGERLKERIFEQIFPYFAEGFISYIREREGKSADLGEERLDAIFRGTLTFLYRLLFLLYAESRDLLPLRTARDYHTVSLTQLKEEIARRAGTILDEVPTKLALYSPKETTFYDRLSTLFTIIDSGDPAKNVPLYNGGLFMTTPAADDRSPEADSAQFLLSYKIPDRFLALGLDRMARDIDPKRGDLVFIDYKSLGVRQFGSIYEGLLEFQLRVAPEIMAVVRGKKTEEILPYAQAKQEKRAILKRGRGREAPEWILPVGTVYLENIKRERKATGSYYTPDYIVQYIVRQTLGPVLEEKSEELLPGIRQAQQKFRESAQRKRTIEKVAPNEPALLNDIAGTVLRDLFTVRVCDPAMGSGHFLVEAVDYITDYLVRFMERFPFLSHFFAGMRRTILEQMERQGVIIDPARLTDVNLLKRHVLKRCVYGVDKNPMAVELAKVSLWLDCFTLGAPLSFLDHHLKCGNSLIGARVLEVHEAVTYGQLSLFGGSQFAGIMLATELMRQVGELEDVTAEQVQQSRAEYRRANEALVPFKRILDVFVSRWFGNAPSNAQEKLGHFPTIDFLRDDRTRAWLVDAEGSTSDLPVDRRGIAKTALVSAHSQQFFHWELEFPEVFFSRDAKEETVIPGLKANGGFDVYIGNPPYVRSIRLKDATPAAWAYYPNVFETAEKGEYDIYLCFAEQGYRLLQRRGRFGMIIPNKWMTTQVGEGLRSLLSKQQIVLQIVDYGAFQVFPEVTTYTCLLFFSKSPVLKTQIDNLIRADATTEPRPEQQGEWQPTITITELPGAKPWSFAGDATQSLLDKLEKLHCLKDIAFVFKGTGTSADSVFQMRRNDAKFFSRSLDEYVEIEEELMKPSLTGRDIDPYYYDTDNFLLFPYSIIDGEAELYSPQVMREKYPKAWGYLNHPINRTSLEGRDKGDFRHRPDWYGYGRPQNMRLLAIPKLVCPDVASQAEFAYDKEGRYIIDTAYGIRLKDKINVSLEALAALLNSSMMTFFLQQTGTILRGGYFRMKTAYLNPFPIPRAFSALTEYEKKYIAATREYRTETLVSYSDPEVIALVEHCLAEEPEESADAYAVLDSLGDQRNYLALTYASEQTTMLNVNKHVLQERFLNWLGQILFIKPDRDGSVGLESLSGKSKLQAALENLSIADLEDVLFKNKVRLGVSLSDSAFTNSLRKEFSAVAEQLRPIRDKLLRADALIDQVVYRLYGLTEDEIEVVEGGKQMQNESNEGSRIATRESDRPRSIARESDPRVLAEMLEELQRQGSVTTKQLADSLRERIGVRLNETGDDEIGTRLNPDHAETIQREFEFLGWLEPGQSRWVLTREGETLANSRPTEHITAFALQICTANDRYNQRVVSRILARLWELNPDGQGAVIIPQPPIESAPAQLAEFRAWLLPLLPRWVDALGKQMAGFRVRQSPDELTDLIVEALGSNWEGLSLRRRSDRLLVVIADRFRDLMFGDFVRPADAKIWQLRMSWAGLTHNARELPGVAGQVWFPVGTFRDTPTDGFTPIYDLMRDIQPYNISTPAGPEFEQRFGEALYRAYVEQQRRERVGYVSLFPIRDQVCYSLRIGNAVFEAALQRLFIRALRSDAPYTLALEVDITPQERVRLGNTLPVVIDRVPRYIIAMRRIR